MKPIRLGTLALLLLVPVASSAVELTATSEDGTVLAGTLHVPDGVRPFPVVVFTHGAECGERSHKGYLRWARPLVAGGIGVLIFDKRGCGESKGTYVEAPDLNLPAADLIAWVDRVAEREEVTSVGVLGWSQGGWVGPLAARKNDRIDFVVAISGPGVSPLEQNIYDKTNQFATTGATREQVVEFERTIRLVWTYLASGEDRAAAEKAWAEISEKDWFKRAYNGPPMMERDRLLRDPRMTHYAAHSSHEPVPVLEALDVPMLAVFGEKDSVVPVRESIEAMKRAFDRPNGRLTVQIVAGANHGLRDGNGRLAKGYPDAVVEWVQGVAVE